MHRQHVSCCIAKVLASSKNFFFLKYTPTNRKQSVLGCPAALCIKSTVAGQTVDEMTQITEETVCAAERRSADVSKRTLTSPLPHSRGCLPCCWVFGRRASGCQAAACRGKKPLGDTDGVKTELKHSKGKVFHKQIATNMWPPDANASPTLCGEE